EVPSPDPEITRERLDAQRAALCVQPAYRAIHERVRTRETPSEREEHTFGRKDCSVEVARVRDPLAQLAGKLPSEHIEGRIRVDHVRDVGVDEVPNGACTKAYAEYIERR